MAKELKVGDPVTRKDTGQVGLIVNLYSGNYIVELSDGDSPRHETLVVTPEALEKEYTRGHKTASLQRTADETEEYQSYKTTITNAVYNLMAGYIDSLSPLTYGEQPPVAEGEAARPLHVSEDCLGAFYTFAKDVAEDLAISRSGETYTNAVQKVIDFQAGAKVAAQRKALDKSYADMLNMVKGDAAATAYVEQKYKAKLATIEEQYKGLLEQASYVKASDYMSHTYILRVAQAIWMSVDVKPRIEKMVSDVATQAGADPASVLEQPMPPTEEELEEQSKISPEIAKATKDNYDKQVQNLQTINVGLKGMLKSSEELKAMLQVLSSGTMARIVRNINRAATPAEVLGSITRYTLNTIADPTTGTQTKHKRREPKMQTYERVAPWAVEQAYPELASVSDVPQEREMAHLRSQFVSSAAAEDLSALEGILAKMEQVKAQYQDEFKELLETSDEDKATTKPELQGVLSQFSKAMRAEPQRLSEWQEKAKEQVPKTRYPAKGDEKKEASVNTGYSAGSPVRYKDNPAVHFIVSYDDSDPNKLYLIPEAEVNSHDRAELIEATINDIQALKVYQIDIGDIVDAFGTAARVVDASAKDLGFVYAELKGSREVVPVDLSKTTVRWSYATPIEFHKCATCEGHVTPGQEHNCPFIGAPMMGKKEDAKPPIDAKDQEKKAAIDLNAALESLDTDSTFPAQPVQKVSEVYEDESNQIEIGSTVKKFGTAICGTVVGYKRQCCVVDWETGVSEPCWKQELVLVNKVEDGH